MLYQNHVHFDVFFSAIFNEKKILKYPLLNLNKNESIKQIAFLRIEKNPGDTVT